MDIVRLRVPGLKVGLGSSQTQSDLSCIPKIKNMMDYLKLGKFKVSFQF